MTFCVDDLPNPKWLEWCCQLAKTPEDSVAGSIFPLTNRCFLRFFSGGFSFNLGFFDVFWVTPRPYVLSSLLLGLRPQTFRRSSFSESNGKQRLLGIKRAWSSGAIRFTAQKRRSFQTLAAISPKKKRSDRACVDHGGILPTTTDTRCEAKRRRKISSVPQCLAFHNLFFFRWFFLVTQTKPKKVISFFKGNWLSIWLCELLVIFYMGALLSLCFLGLFVFIFLGFLSKSFCFE